MCDFKYKSDYADIPQEGRVLINVSGKNKICKKCGMPVRLAKGRKLFFVEEKGGLYIKHFCV